MQEQTAADLGFIHRFVPAEADGKTPLLLLHGTGGDESDLIPLGIQLAPGAALLSPRGKVLERGMARFFRRREENVFDEEDRQARAEELGDFLDAARKHYGIGKPIAVGFSNGANIAWSLLFQRTASLAGAILIRGAMPSDPVHKSRLDGLPILVLNGDLDPIVPTEMRERLVATLTAQGADLRHEVLPTGHQLTQRDLAIATEWLRDR